MKSKFKLTLTALVLLFTFNSTVNASLLSEALDKAARWPGGQLFGSTPRKANEAAGAATIAANKASALTDEAQAKLKILAPKAETALDMFNSSYGYVAGSFIALMALICLLLAPKVISAWKVALSKAKAPAQSAEPAGGTPSPA